MLHIEWSGTRGLGFEAVQKIYRWMRVDAEWSVWDENGFTWWAGPLAQRIWTEPAFESGGLVIWRLRAATDLLRGVAWNETNCKGLAVLSAYSTVAGLVADPNDPGRLRMESAVYLHRQNREWLERLFALVVALQVTQAHVNGPAAAALLGAEPDDSAHPEFGSRTEPDDMLNVIEQLVKPRGLEASCWAGPEMLLQQELLSAPPLLRARAARDELEAEFPFGDKSSFLRAVALDNPQLGNGVLLTLNLPVSYPMGGPESGELPFFLRLNAQENDCIIKAPFLGSWCCGPELQLCYVCFLPNLAHRNGMLTTFVDYLYHRMLWVTQSVFGLGFQGNRNLRQ